MNKLAEAKEKVRKLSVDALAIVEDAALSGSEKKSKLDPIETEIATWTGEVQALEYVESKRKGFLSATQEREEHPDPIADRAGLQAKSIGAQFVASDAYQAISKKLRDGLSNSSVKWSSEATEVEYRRAGEYHTKELLTEGTSGDQGGAGSLVYNTPMIVPGIVDIRFLELTVADLFAQGVTNSPLIKYFVETVAENAAAAVAEGDLKPESALEFDVVSGELHKIATLLPVTDETLEDWAQAMSYIDARLVLFIKQEEELQLLRGDGTDANLVGILNRAGLAPAIAKGTTPSASDDNSMDAVYRQITAIRYSSFLDPDAIVMDPIAWEGMVLSKNLQGAYFANGPFMSVDVPRVWSKRVVATPNMTSREALVGAFQAGGQVFRKGGLRLDASNSHNDNFARNKTTIRAEQREELAVYRPGAFGLVTNL